MPKGGIDHGLQGKNNDKSRQRRVKKAKRVKAIAQKALGRSREVYFNESEREEYLTGFHARKQERRKFGIAMQMINDKNKHKLERKKTRTKTKTTGEEVEVEESEDTIDNRNGTKSKNSSSANTSNTSDSNSNSNSNSSSNSEIVFNDQGTTDRFGSSVSVVIDDGLAEELDDLHSPDLAPRSRGPKAGQMTRKELFDAELQKALKKAKVTMNERKTGKKSRKKEAQRVSDWKSGKLSGKKQAKKKKKK